MTRSKRYALSLISLAIVIGFGVWLLGRSSTLRNIPPQTLVLDPPMEARVEAFCRACHALPLASSFPRDAWHHEVMQGYQFYAISGRKDLDPPPPSWAIAYFRSRAPERLTLESPTDASQPMKIRFRTQHIQLPEDQEIPPGVAFLKWCSLRPQERYELVTLDMRRGELLAYPLTEPMPAARQWLRMSNPCRLTSCDLDGDGQTEFVTADLGSFDPGDHDWGKVLWIRTEGTKPVVHELFRGVGRIADVRPLDFDQDGKQDLVVAEFGWHQTGAIWLLRQTSLKTRSVSEGQQTDVPKFEPKRLLSLPGTIHVPVHDFDGDGRPDVLALISQEHERLDLFLNRHTAASNDGDSNPDSNRQQPTQDWERRTIWAAPDPAFGCSGIELVDLDNDGDVDVLLSNGDSFDSMYLKPSHGVQWLRNGGELEFVMQHIGSLPGAYCARAGDLDGDGDQDILVSVWLPRQSPNDLDRTSLATLTCFEQTAPGQFARHTLERGQPYAAALELADFDDDGDLDFAVGSNLANTQQSRNAVSIWWSDRKP